MDLKLGSVVYSKMGRDKGKYYIVTEIVDDEFVKIADGDLRKLRTAKLKRVKHVRANGDVLERIAVKLADKQQIFDAEVRSALRAYNEEN